MKLGEVCDNISVTFDKTKQQVVLVNTSDVLNGKVTNHVLVNNKGLKGQFKKTFQKDDILYSEIRPKNKRFAFIDFNANDYVASTKLMVIRANKKVLPQYLYQVLKSEEVINQLQALAESRSGTFPQITFSELAQINVRIPKLDEQKEIANFLKLFDDKIENNKKINHHLEQMATSIFENMFPNVSSGKSTIGNYIIPKRGKNLLSKDAIVGKVPVVAGGLQPSTFHNIANTKSPVLTISASGANAGYVNLWHIPVWSSDSSYIDTSITDNVYFWYVMLKKRQQEIYDSQTGSAQPHIYPKHIEIMPTIDLSEDKVSRFTKQVTPLFESIGNNIKEIGELQTLRDTLLPKLLSGEISVNQAAK
ncbi:restriction endonuclease subunit S [Streptococcus intermedius]|uniref:Type I restriction enzyme n=1 Tax=Streptococcus intermedius TaxID=1338 RepID=A0AAD1C7K9_STRIT|nr:restriction endonuclease subunit S [Streptococcus intermedius]RSJ20987.1 putative type-1 restriction enzyme specificity protein MG438 [Streptococcus intermedius]BAW16706.1 putative type I restriction enzyme [Streptococcus intermedius]